MPMTSHLSPTLGCGGGRGSEDVELGAHQRPPSPVGAPSSRVAGVLTLVVLLAAGRAWSGLWLAVLPFWPAMSALTWRGWAQRLGLFSRRPLGPPSRLRVKLETGASGTVSKVVRRRPLTVSTWPTRAIVDLAV